MVSPVPDLEDPSKSRPWPSFGEEEEDGDGVDQLDRLPDPLILVILNLVGDVKALGRCSAASRRFRSLVPLVEEVVVRVDCVISDEPPSSSGSSSSIASVDKTRGILSHLARLVLSPLQTLGQILLFNNSSAKRSCSDLSPSSSSSSQVSHHSPAEVLKSFREIRRLRIELPSGELGVDEGVLLKWKASFGSTLHSCVILGAASKSPNPNPNPVLNPSSDDSGSIPESFYTNGSLKLRVVWTISSLIAASARHYLLQPIISDHETLESLELTDADGQGTLMMDAGQLRELWTRPVSASGSSQRTLVLALSMKLWYASQLEIPGGVMLKGATLVAIRPSEEQQQLPRESSAQDGGCWVSNAFEEPFRTAAKMLVKRRTYSLEMNSF